MLVSVIVLVAGACGGNDSAGGPDRDSTTSSTRAKSVVTTGAQPVATAEEPADEVVVVEDVVYRSGEEEAWSLDVYHSTARQDGPVVVLYHGGGVDKSFPAYPPLARDLAEQGAVVFVANWNDRLSDDVDGFVAGYSAAACAVSYALVHADDYGTSHRGLVVTGHSGGADIALSTGGLWSIGPADDCVEAMAPFTATRFVLWDGDWLMGDPIWNRYEEDLQPELMLATRPWTRLEDTPRVPVVLATSSRTPDQLRRCDIADASSSFWVRDPDGSLWDRLERMGAFDDGCIDNGEGQELLAVTMAEHGFDATHIILEESTHIHLSDEGRAQLADAIMADGN
jgi:acetyl esterase/lipase